MLKKKDRTQSESQNDVKVESAVLTRTCGGIMVEKFRCSVENQISRVSRFRVAVAGSFGVAEGEHWQAGKVPVQDGRMTGD